MAELVSRERLLPGTRGLEATVEVIRNRIAEGGRDWAIVQLARRIVAPVAPFDYRGEAEAIFEWIAANVTYRKDPVDGELVQGARATIQERAGDCDDFTVLAGALLQALGHPCRVVVAGSSAVRPGERPRYHHVYLRVYVSNERTWIAFDPVLRDPRRRPTAGLGDEMPRRVERSWPVRTSTKPALRKVTRVVATSRPRPLVRPAPARPATARPASSFFRAQPIASRLVRPSPVAARVVRPARVQPVQTAAPAPRPGPFPVQTSALPPAPIDWAPEDEVLDENAEDAPEEADTESAAADDFEDDYSEVGASFYERYLKPLDPTRPENKALRSVVQIIPGGGAALTALDVASTVNKALPQPPKPPPPAPPPAPAAPRPPASAPAASAPRLPASAPAASAPSVSAAALVGASSIPAASGSKLSTTAKVGIAAAGAAAAIGLVVAVTRRRRR